MVKEKVPFKNRAWQVNLRFCVAILCMVFGSVLQGLPASPGDVVINEIAWMGTEASSGDEWIELANNTNTPINIKDWSIHGADSKDCLNFTDADGNRSWVVPSYGYLIYASHEDDVNNSEMETNVDIWDATISMINSSPGQVVLYDAQNCAGTEIDRVNQPTGGWFAGNSTDRTTMERIDPNAAGVEEANWVTNDPDVARNGLDASQSPINGTPKSKNSATNSATNSPPTAAFTYSPLSPTTQQTVQFTNESNDPDGSISSWQWSFGDGGSSTTQNPTHQYTDDGAYTVTLKVTDDDGATDSTSHSVTISNQAPIASFDYSPSEPETNEIVNFNASGSSDPDGSIEKYKWDFGDSSTGTGQKLAHSYSDNNAYTVTLTVTDDDGATNSTSKHVTVASLGPTAAFTYSPSTPTTQQTIQFTDESNDPDGSISSWQWSFGDGGSSTTQNPTHQYTDDGAYTVTLKVTDDDGATDSTSHSVTISNQAPIASFDYSPSEPETNEIVNFNASGSSDPDGSIEKYKWDFGDSSTGTGQKLAHSYSDNNAYTVTLTVTDDDGATNSTSKHVTVASLGPEIELKTPAGREIWKGTEEIKWDGTDPDDCKDSLKITLSYSDDSGITWNTIATDTENDGTYGWDTTKVVNGEYKIRVLIEDPGGLTAEGVSNPFTINNILLGVELITYGPNPVPSEGCIFWLNLPNDTLDATLKIFDIDGAALPDICLDPTAGRYPQTGRWLPQDEKGRLLGTGLYLYLVEIKHTDGTTTYSPVQKMVIDR